MIWLKACSKCRGDLFEDSDWYGPYIQCFQCGRMLTDMEATQLKMATRPRDAKVPGRVVAGAFDKDSSMKEAA